MSCVICLLLPCYICLVELLAALLSYCLWLFVFSWFKSRRESIDLGILPLLSCQAFFVSALSFPTKGSGGSRVSGNGFQGQLLRKPYICTEKSIKYMEKIFVENLQTNHLIGP